MREICGINLWMRENKISLEGDMAMREIGPKWASPEWGALAAMLSVWWILVQPEICSSLHALHVHFYFQEW